MNGYELSRGWFDFCFENPEKINPNHTAIYMFAIEHCNRLGWKKKFGFPSQMTMDALGIKKHQTYIRYFNDLVDWGFFDLIEKSKNQYSSNIISLISAIPKNGKALDKAIINHVAKQTETMGQSNSSINKPLTNKPINNSTPSFSFKKSLIQLGGKKELVDDWLKVRKIRRLANTETALKKFLSEVEKSGRGINEVLTKCAEKSWGGFDSSWKWEDKQVEVKKHSNNSHLFIT